MTAAPDHDRGPRSGADIDAEPGTSAICSHSASAATEQAVLNFCRQCPVTAQCLEHALTHDDRWGLSLR
ncbi:WhiB family transcriptional regulator [Rhodococcus rhodochrous]|uniref:WhiB family transcriptional regulator n=1 Tax=Rhodococcus rhodochrous TaxID=1829 RepID=UPI0011A2E2A4